MSVFAQIERAVFHVRMRLREVNAAVLSGVHLLRPFLIMLDPLLLIQFILCASHRSKRMCSTRSKMLLQASRSNKITFEATGHGRYFVTRKYERSLVLCSTVSEEEMRPDRPTVLSTFWRFVTVVSNYKQYRGKYCREQYCPRTQVRPNLAAGSTVKRPKLKVLSHRSVASIDSTAQVLRVTVLADETDSTARKYIRYLREYKKVEDLGNKIAKPKSKRDVNFVRAAARSTRAGAAQKPDAEGSAEESSIADHLRP